MEGVLVIRRLAVRRAGWKEASWAVNQSWEKNLKLEELCL